jgi:hypothetical protein
MQSQQLQRVERTWGFAASTGRSSGASRATAHLRLLVSGMQTTVAKTARGFEHERRYLDSLKS